MKRSERVRGNLFFYVCMLSYIPNAQAKFKSGFPGFAIDAVNACLQKYPNGTERSNCGNTLACIFDEQLSNTEQTIVNSGMAILGLLPTVLTMLGNTSQELLYISTQYPVLALLLSICNPSTTIIRTPWKPTSGPTVSSICFDDLEAILDHRRARKDLKNVGCIKHYAALAVIHAVTAVGAGVVLWRTVSIAQNGVVAWACWTSFYPIIYVAGGPFQHLLKVSLGTLCIRYGGNHKTVLATLIETFVGGIAKGLYVFGTCVFSSLLLISGIQAVKFVAEFAAVAAVSRMATMYLLAQIGTNESQINIGAVSKVHSLQSARNTHGELCIEE